MKIKAKGRDEMIEAIAEQIHYWDMETLIAWAQDRMRELYKDATDAVVLQDFEALSEERD